MTFKLPNPSEVKNIYLQVLESEIPELNPNTSQEWSKTLFISNSLMCSQYIDSLRTAYNDNFILTASRDALIKTGQEYATPLLQEQRSTGLVATQANSQLEIIPAGSQFSIKNNVYTNESASVSFLYTNNVASITYDSINDQTDVLTTNLHNYITNLILTINDVEYEVIKINSEFSFSIAGDQTSNINPSDLINVLMFLVNIISQDSGIDKNVNANTIVDSDVSSNVIRVTYAGINGGADVEKTEDYRNRLLTAAGLAGGCLTTRGLRELLDNNGLNYIDFNFPYSQEGGDPDVGITKIYLLRSNSVTTSLLEINRIRSLIIDNIYPVYNDPANLIIENAALIQLNFTIANLKMNTISGVVDASQTLRVAVETSLTKFFIEESSIGEPIPRSRYIDAVGRAIDGLGNTVASFDITSPAGDISQANNEKINLGGVSFV